MRVSLNIPCWQYHCAIICFVKNTLKYVTFCVQIFVCTASFVKCLHVLYQSKTFIFYTFFTINVPTNVLCYNVNAHGVILNIINGIVLYSYLLLCSLNCVITARLRPWVCMSGLVSGVSEEVSTGLAGFTCMLAPKWISLSSNNGQPKNILHSLQICK